MAAQLAQRCAAMRARAAEARRQCDRKRAARTPRWNPSSPLGLIARAFLIVALVLFVVYPLYAWFYSTIDDNRQFRRRRAEHIEAGHEPWPWPIPPR